MMSSFLSLHSLVRWLVLISFVLLILKSIYKWKHKKSKTSFDGFLVKITLFIFTLQVFIGLYLYSQSPIVHYFLSNFKEAMPETEVRFFGMEHITAMLISYVLVLLGSFKARKINDHRVYFKTIILWFSFALIIIFLSIPWSFSPFTARPEFRFLGY